MFEKTQLDELNGLDARRLSLIVELTSAKHYSDTPMVAYGTHDPFDVPLAICDTCQSTPKMRKVTPGRKIRWTVTCISCDKQIAQPQKDSWLAALIWNGTNLTTQSYRTLPLFGVGHLSPAAAKEHISRIRHNLVLRISLCTIDRAIGEKGDTHSKSGLMYQKRLEAYLKWAMHAHRLIKLAKEDGVEKGSEKVPRILASLNAKTCTE
jgi:hypothetical protein